MLRGTCSIIIPNTPDRNLFFTFFIPPPLPGSLTSDRFGDDRVVCSLFTLDLLSVCASIETGDELRPRPRLVAESIHSLVRVQSVYEAFTVRFSVTITWKSLRP